MRFHLPCGGRHAVILARAALLLTGLALASPAAAQAESVNVIKPWVKVLAAPKAGAKPIALAYGNDNYEVLDEQGDWVKIRARGNAVGWVTKEDVHAVVDPIAAKALGFALELKNAGRDKEARAKLFEVVTRFPGTFQSYEATRHLLTWHPVGQLNEPQDRKVGQAEHREAERLASWMMVLEGRGLIGEKRYDDAVAMFEEARKRGKLNRSAMDGIREALQADHREASQAGDTKRADMTLMALRAYFPTVDNPESFKLETFRRPTVRKPSMNPLVPPPPAIPEEDQLPPSTHEFERKELELAPVPDNSLPAPPSQVPPGAEPGMEGQDKPRSEPKESVKPDAGPPPSEPAPPKEARPSQPNERTDAPKPPPAKPPKRKDADERLKPRKPAQQAALPSAPESALPPAPQSTPPGFPAQATDLSNKQETARRGLWPVPENTAVASEPKVPVDQLPGFAIAKKEVAQPALPGGTPGEPASQTEAAQARGLWAVAVQNAAPLPPPPLSELNERPALSSPGAGR